MSDWPRSGDKLVFVGRNGYDRQIEAALKVLTPGQLYTVVDCRVGDWEHSVALEGIDGRFNGVMFESPPPSTERGG